MSSPQKSLHLPDSYIEYTTPLPSEVNASRVNMRDEPSLQARVLKTLARRTQIVALGEYPYGKIVWARIKLPSLNDTAKERYGWMAKRYLSAQPKQAPSVPKQSPISVRSSQENTSQKKSVQDLSPSPTPLQRNEISLTKNDIQGQIARSQDLQFSVLTRGTGTPNALIFAGIQGDEPGGFSAASLLTTHYTFTKGQVTIVPNLNFHSIVQRARGTYGDMNRKFAKLRQNDPQYQDIARTKQLIQESNASVIFNLHDGSGFYRPHYENKTRNPKRWGQSIVIDMDYRAGITLPELRQTADYVAKHVNAKLLRKHDAIFVRNTHTDKGNKEMNKTLTWFAIRQGKAAFALEASKSFNVPQRAYYHLSMLEAFFTKLGIEFSRSFPLSPAGIQSAMKENVFFAFNNGRIHLPLQNIRRKHQSPISLPKDHQAIVSSPILAATYLDDRQSRLQVHYGNNRLTQFPVRWRETDMTLPSVTLDIDGSTRTVYMGEIIDVSASLAFLPLQQHSIHPIGTNTILPPTNTQSTPLTKKRTFSKKDFAKNSSLDKNAAMYRVEFLRDDKLAGTLIIRFAPRAQNAFLLPAQANTAKALP